ncbi:hypothetical protein R1flu_004976 [Riccia fluitans]|uniref:Uncharacterized protein n=1 Tax=Riccia fluitans TaxID=41844 RepID=A0ABD1YRU2_9MARC
MDPPLLTPTRQTSSRGNNHIALGDTTKEVPPTLSKLRSDGIMEESINQMTTMLFNILEHHGRANQRLASLKEDLVHARREEEKLKATIQALEREKSDECQNNFFVDKFFSLQDPISPDDVQADLDFEEDLTTNERLRLRVESRNLMAKSQWLTRSTRICLKYEPTILSNVPPTDNLALPITLDSTVDAHKDPSSPP